MTELPSSTMSAYERYQELNVKQVAKFIGVESSFSVWDYVKRGLLPEPRYIRPHAPRWRLGEVVDHTHRIMKSADETTTGFKGKPKPPKNQQDDNDNLLQKMRQRLKLG